MSGKKPSYKRIIIAIPKLQHIRQVAIDTFTLPNGKLARWESLYNPPEKPTVLVAALTTHNTLVLVQFFRFPPEEIVYNLPGGSVNDGESYEQAAYRELLEETGYSSDYPLENLTRFWIQDGKSNAHAVVFVAYDCRKVAKPTLDDVEAYAGLTPVERTPREILNGITQGDRSYNPSTSHAFLALLGRGLINV